MLINTLKYLFKRDLGKLKKEILAYQTEANIWVVDKNITNSAGNLCLHLVGNLQTFIGLHLGNTGYVRQRDLEFSLKDVPRATLVEQIDDTITVIENTLNQLTVADLEKMYPILVFKDEMPTGLFLTHLATHLTYHLGQVNYHRRLLDSTDEFIHHS